VGVDGALGHGTQPSPCTWVEQADITSMRTAPRVHAHDDRTGLRTFPSRAEEEARVTNHGALLDLEIDDVEYVRHGSLALLTRIYRPHGPGPFPIVVDVHGGAWWMGDRLTDTVIDQPLAESGVVVASLDFRMPPAASYPASMADVNYAIRWLKAHASELNARSDLVGILGVSSGGHQAMLAAMRPRDPRYCALPLPAGSAAVDGVVRCVVLVSPVIDPLARYHYARDLKAAGTPYPDFVDRVLPGHDLYWQTEQAMCEGNPVLALERGEQVELPPVLCIQGTADPAHPRADIDRFVALYRRAGGTVDLELCEGADNHFMLETPNAPTARSALRRIIQFVHGELSLRRKQ